MWQVVLGRVISGAGTAGMTALVSILITGQQNCPMDFIKHDLKTLLDLLPIREVAQWRAFVNVVATTGRAAGGPLGGWLADVVGWRW